MLSILNDCDRAIVETINMRLHEKEALQYLQDHGYQMSARKYYRHKKQIEDMKLERMHHIAKFFPDQHLERIDKLELIEKLCWDNYHKEKDPLKRVKILESIKELQPYISSYYNVTQAIIQMDVKNNKQIEQLPKQRINPKAWTVNDNEVEAEAWTVDNEGTITTASDGLLHKDKDNVRDKDGWAQVQCPDCKQWFNSNVMLSLHECERKEWPI
jgi:hypothetical protein